jgi:hypothetical protein
MPMTEVQYKDASGKWQKLHTPPGVTMDEKAFAFAQTKQTGLVTRCIEYKPNGEVIVTAGPFQIQRQK